MKNERIVCLVPSLTELLVDLGLKSHLVGATNYCVHPPKLNVTRISGTKNPNLTKILDLNPTYLICNREENRREDIEYVQNALPECRLRITDIGSFEESLTSIRLIAEDLDIVAEGNDLINELSQIMTDLQKIVQSHSGKPLKILYLIWKNPWMTVGTDTYIHNILKSLNLESCINDVRYPVIDSVELAELDWDVLLLSSEPYPFKESDCLKLANATRRPVLLVNGEHYSWYGSRMIHAAKSLKLELNQIFSHQM